MKAKILIPVLLLLIISLFAGNWIYGKMSAKKVEAYLDNLPNADVKYDHVTVNPLMAKIKINQFEYQVPDKEIVFYCNELTISIPHSDAMKIVKEKSLDEINKLGIEGNDIVVANMKGDTLVVSDNLDMDFDGALMVEDLKNLQIDFPEEDQDFDLTIRNTRLGSKATDDSVLKTLAETKQIDKIGLEIKVKAKEGKMLLEDFIVKSKEMLVKGDADIDFTGETRESMKPVYAKVKYEMSMPDNLTWEDEKGKYSVKSFNSSFSGKLNLKENGEFLELIDEADVDIDLKELTFDYDEATKATMNQQLAMLGLNSDDLSIKGFSLHSKIDSSSLIIENTELLLPVLKAGLTANMHLDRSNFNNSQINAFQLIISNINPKLDEALGNLSKTFGFKIQREEDNIVFEVKGSFQNPQIKGVHY